MNFLQKSVQAAIILCLSFFSSPLISGPSQITGAAGSKFLVDVTGETEIALPALLLFNPAGCLVWTELGLDETTWSASLSRALSEKGGDACSNAELPGTLAKLAADGVEIAPADIDGRYVFFWYGSEQLCPPCVQKKKDVWPMLQASLPKDSITILLNWKQ